MPVSIQLFLAGLVALIAPFMVGLALKFFGWGEYAQWALVVCVAVSALLFMAGSVFSVLDILRTRKK